MHLNYTKPKDLQHSLTPVRAVTTWARKSCSSSKAREKVSKAQPHHLNASWIVVGIIIWRWILVRLWDEYLTKRKSLQPKSVRTSLRLKRLQVLWVLDLQLFLLLKSIFLKVRTKVHQESALENNRVDMPVLNRQILYHNSLKIVIRQWHCKVQSLLSHPQCSLCLRLQRQPEALEWQQLMMRQ